MKLHKEFFHYVIPSMLAFALSGVYAIADGFFVGNALGDSALAAVNIAYPLTAFYRPSAPESAWAAQSSTPSAPARKIIKGAASISVCLSLC